MSQRNSKLESANVIENAKFIGVFSVMLIFFTLVAQLDESGYVFFGFSPFIAIGTPVLAIASSLNGSKGRLLLRRDKHKNNTSLRAAMLFSYFVSSAIIIVF